MSIEEILQHIRNLPLKEAISFLAARGVFDLAKQGYESIRKNIQDKTSEKKYGFIPDKREGNFLLKVAERTYFQEFGYLLPNNKYSDLIRVGYLISHLNKLGGEPIKSS